VPSERESAWTALVDAVAAMPGVAGKLAREHLDDGHGRCRACTHSGRVAEPFPCVLSSLAAAVVARGKRGGIRLIEVVRECS